MSGAHTPGIVPTAPYVWSQQTSVPPASPYTPQPECKFLFQFCFTLLQLYIFYLVVKAPFELITTVVPVGPHSTRMVCSNCRKEITTNINKRPSTMAYITSLLCCVFG